MKRYFSIALLFVLPVIGLLHAQEVPFSKGVNLTSWFQVNNAEQVHFTKYTKSDFEQIKSLGCDVIRLPIDLIAMLEDDGNINPLFYVFMDEVVQWATELEIYLILDNHHFDPNENTQLTIEQPLIEMWSQIADHYKGSSQYVLYEILNEPHGIADSDWNNIQKKVINEIRKYDNNHFIIVGGAGFNSFNNLKYLDEYDDEKLIYTFHFYEPFLFTHQGASWVGPSMAPLSGVPFPFKPAEMPSMPSEFDNTWLEYAYNDYSQKGNENAMEEALLNAVVFRDERNVPIFCGEFGAYIPNCEPDDRLRYYGALRRLLNKYEIPWTMWDYEGGFGLYNDGQGLFEHDINTALVDSLGLIVPAQTPFIKVPDSIGFPIYNDFIEPGIFSVGYTEGHLNFYNEEQPQREKYNLSWSGAQQYNTISFGFIPNKDIQYLVNNDFALDFFLKSSSSNVSFDIRFVDSKTDVPEDLPWRSRITIEPQHIETAGEWHHFHFPLKNFQEQGSWYNNTWHNPMGQFDWKDIDLLEIVAEYGSLSGVELQFDQIIITDLDTATVVSSNIDLPNPVANKISISPNPANNLIFITGLNGQANFEIFEIGAKVVSSGIVDDSSSINVGDLENGFYFLRISIENQEQQVLQFVKY